MLTEPDQPEEPLIHVLEIVGNAIVGGMEKYVYNVTQKLPAYDFKISCLSPYESSFTASLRHQGADVYVTTMDEDPSWRSIQFTAELIRYLKVDLIHAHLPKAHVLAGLAGKLAGRPVVATIHGMDINPIDLSVAMTAGTHLIVVCQAAYQQTLAFGVPAERLSLIPNGVDTKTYSANRSGSTFRKALHLAPEVPLVGFVGRLAWEKGPDQFIQMAVNIHKQRPDVHFALVGDGSMEGELRAWIEGAQLDKFIHMPGLWTNTWEVYPAFDILAQTSRIEGMPFAVLEAMACGCPVAAIGVGGVTEIIEVGTTGLLSAPTDWEGLGNGILKLLDNPERIHVMGNAARKRVEELFDLQTSIRHTGALFHRIVGRPLPGNLNLSSRWPLMNPAQPEPELSQVNLFHKKDNGIR